ncbi:stalk domain-containing protein [Caldisericum exile]|uniref:Copper amine oxidase-like N-terminal domain-containing protein n=1 Tax=Caldisericum exile (strain DSM 21853 / NBRC 104410 / AZM16c01) TaxID=511051 RepID=A0A7U6GDE6_CALEA|nr:stalk domain-containing protein [Caldisericum exile]BAL80262.1 hypothetical protein CSE_01360 [Caldisericum exile AZM16c01]
MKKITIAVILAMLFSFITFSYDGALSRNFSSIQTNFIITQDQLNIEKENLIPINLLSNTSLSVVTSTNSFLKTFGTSGYEEGNAISLTNDGGYLITGTIETTEGLSKGVLQKDIFFTKFNSNNQIERFNLLGGVKDDAGVMTVQVSNGDYILIGNTNSYGKGGSDIYVITMHKGGFVAETFGGSGNDSASYISITQDGGYIIAGSTTSFGAGGQDFLILKFDSDGKLSWAKTFGTPNEDTVSSVIQMRDGGFAILGSTYSNDAWNTIFIEIDSNGMPIMSRVYSQGQMLMGKSIVKTSDGGYVIGGVVRAGSTDPTSAIIFKVNNSGFVDWAFRLGDALYNDINSIIPTYDGGVVAAGSTTLDKKTSSDCLVMKFSSNGLLQWAKRFGGNKVDFSKAVVQAVNEDYLIVGTTSSFGSGSTDVLLARLTKDGDIKLNISTGNINLPETYFSNCSVNAYPVAFSVKSATLYSSSLKPNEIGANSSITIALNNPPILAPVICFVTFYDSFNPIPHATRYVLYNHSIGSDMPQNPTREGYTFTGWNTKSDGSGASFTYSTVVSSEDLKVYAQWKINTYTITASASSGGSITPSGSVVVNHGDSKTFTIQPNLGFKIKEVKVDGSSVGAVSTYTFTNITGNHTIEAIFEKVEDKIVMILQIGNARFTVNGVAKTLDSPPIIKNSRTLLPIRAVVESLGGTIDWNGTERKVTISFKGKNIELWIGKAIAMVDGVSTQIDPDNKNVVPEIINSRTMLPLRFVAESLGCVVQWDGTTKTITITYPKP